jgi:hypothetical protein
MKDGEARVAAAGRPVQAAVAVSGRRVMHVAVDGQIVGLAVLTLVTVTGEFTKTGAAAAHVLVVVQALALDMVHPLAAAVSVMTVGSDQVRIIIINRSSSSSSSVDSRQASSLHAARMDCTTITITISSSSRARVCHCHMLEHICTVLLVVRRPPAWV